MTDKGDCRKCPKYDTCDRIEPDPKVPGSGCINEFIRANLKNTEAPRRKKTIRIVYLHDLEANEWRRVESMFYGEYDED